LKISKNPALSNLAIILAAKHLGENIKNPALTNTTYTVASHFARIARSDIAKLPQLHWQQNTLENIKNLALTNLAFIGTSHFARIPKSSINLALPNCHTYTGCKTTW